MNHFAELVMKYGHTTIEATLLWIAVMLHRHGVKMTFDIHFWKNGKHKDGNSDEKD